MIVKTKVYQNAFIIVQIPELTPPSETVDLSPILLSQNLICLHRTLSQNEAYENPGNIIGNMNHRSFNSCRQIHYLKKHM